MIDTRYHATSRFIAKSFRAIKATCKSEGDYLFFYLIFHEEEMSAKTK